MKRFSKFLSILLVMCLLSTSIPIDVEAASVSKPRCTKKMTMTVGQKKVIKVRGKNIKKKTFKSTNKKVATVNKKGKVTAKKKGKCTIKIKVKYKKTKHSKKYSTKTLKCKVTVKAKKKKITKSKVKKPQVTTRYIQPTTKKDKETSNNEENTSSEEISSNEETSNDKETSSDEETSSNEETSSSEEESTSSDIGFIDTSGDAYKVYWGSNEIVIEKEHYVEVSKGDTSHTHVLSSRTIVQPTCTEDGYVKYSCNCGYEFKDTSLGKKSGHNYKLVPEKSDVVNCGNKSGVHTYVCVTCGDEKTETITCDDEHIYSDWRVIKDPTCTEAGIQEKQCKVCGGVVEEEIPSLGHNYTDSVIVNDPTCNANGYSVKICKICDDHKYNVIPALGHEYNWVTTKEPTCTESGIKENICSGCSDVCDTQDIPALGHTESDWRVVKDSTCIEVGNKQKVCITCGAVLEEQEIPVKEHVEGDWIIIKQSTCIENGSREKRCEVCDSILESETLPLLGHTESDWEIVRDSTCTNLGIKRKTCTTCGVVLSEEEIPLKEHVEGDWIRIKVPTCTVEGQERKLCSVCHSVVESRGIPALGHDYKLEYESLGSGVVTSVSTKAVCSRCNDTINLGEDDDACTFGAHAWCIELINKDYDGRLAIYIHCAKCGCHAPTTQSFADACELEAHEYKVSDDSTVTNQVVECIHCGVKKSISDFPSGVLCERYGLHNLDEEHPYACDTCSGKYLNSKCKGVMSCEDALIEERQDIRGNVYVNLYEKYVCSSCGTYYKKEYAHFSASANSADYTIMLSNVSRAKSSWVKPEPIACTKVCGDCQNKLSRITDFTDIHRGSTVWYYCSHCNGYIHHLVSGDETWYQGE